MNPEQILYVESIPDTVVTLTTAEKLYIKEVASEIQRRFLAYKKKIFAEALHGSLPAKKSE